MSVMLAAMLMMQVDAPNLTVDPAVYAAGKRVAMCIDTNSRRVVAATDAHMIAGDRQLIYFLTADVMTSCYLPLKVAYDQKKTPLERMQAQQKMKGITMMCLADYIVQMYERYTPAQYLKSCLK